MLGRFGQASKAGQFAKGDVHAKGAAARLEAPDPALEVLRQVGRVDHPFVEQFRSDVCDHARCSDFLAADQLDPDRLAPVDQHLFDGAFEADLDAMIAAHLRHRSEEHTSELQSLMRISYAVFCLKKKNTKH